jgi:hypothetical protein
MLMQTLNTVVAVALLSGAGISAVNAVVPMACDTDGDSYIDATEASTCTEQRFEEISAGQQNITPERFSKAFPEAENPEQLFGEADQDGDGKISLAEWRNWHEQGFTAATEASQGRMPTADYESMLQRFHPTAVVKPDQNKQ